ncbi:blast:Gamma-tubulin complex component 3 [Drosophila guanche]|uniref:Blast:Gamma-tubulin complex component 3 n=1 Tax=Drosophila guanche TaxID=7266 RepID=A0A3B0KFM7_DROGU|nr:blast:Gamma-tubulin complex component 3 [Drosophila guanche]
MDNKQLLFETPPTDDLSEDKLDSAVDSDDYDIFMGIYELSVTLGHYHPNIKQIMRVLAKSQTPNNDSMEVAVLNEIRLRFEDLQEGNDAEEKPLHGAEQEIFMYLYKELSNLQPDERERVNYLKLSLELFDEERRKDLGTEETLSNRLRSIDRLHLNIEKIVARIDASTDEASNVDSLAAFALNISDGRDDSPVDIPVGTRLTVAPEGPKGMPADDPNGVSVLDDADITFNAARAVSVPVPVNDIQAVSKATDNPREILAAPADTSAGVLNVSRADAVTLHSNVSFNEQSNVAQVNVLDHLELEHLKHTQLLISEFIQNITVMVKGVKGANSDPNQKNTPETFEDLSFTDDDLLDNSLSKLTVQKRKARATAIPLRQKSNDKVEELIDCSKILDQQTSVGVPSKWQHQRHIFAAPRDIFQLFKSNPAYQWPPNDLNAPDFFEQLDQFYEVTAHKDNAPTTQVNVSSVQSRLKSLLRSIKKDLPKNIRYSDWLIRVGKCQLTQLLTSEEREAYDTWRWQLRDSGGHELTDEDRYRDALKGLMGSESAHLKWSALNSRLLLRYPHHQHSISDSYLLLALGHVGYLYRSLSLKMQELAQRGAEGDQALAEYIHGDLSSFHEFHNEQSARHGSLFGLFLRTRGFQQRFQYLLNLLLHVKSGKSPVVTLYNQLGQRVDREEETLQKWLMIASNELLSKLHSWLLKGQLPASPCEEFFIFQNLALTTDKFWQERFQLSEPFSLFFDSRLTTLLISIGRSHVYSKVYLFTEMETLVSARELHNRLVEAFQQLYQNGDQEPLYQLVSELHLDVCGKVIRCLYNYEPTPLDLFQNLHKYLLLTDVQFVRQLIELLEPVLEGPASTYDSELLNYMISNMLPNRIPDLYVGEAISEGSKCWSRFELHWKLPIHWMALLGESLLQYESIFPGLWKFHHAYYVLCQRTMRQDWHFRQLNQLDNKCLVHVQCHFDKLIDILLDLMDGLKIYLLQDVLDVACAKFKLTLQQVKSIEEMLDANRIYLEAVKLGSFQMKTCKRSSDYLEKVYSLILDLELRQQKFHRLFQIYLNYDSDESYVGSIYSNSLNDFRLSCQKTCDSLNELEEEIYAAISDFLLSLHVSGYPSFRSLARKLDSQGLYKNQMEVLRFVDTFAFQRMLKSCKT